MPSWGDDALWAQGLTGVGQQFTAAASLAARSRPGRWNDPDMLVVGISWPQFVTGHPGMVLSPEHPDLSADEQRAHISLWAMLAAPLLAGNDVRAMTSQTRDILTNGEVIAVDQDPLAIQGHALPQDPRVIVKPLVDGAAAVALFNDTAWQADIATDAAASACPRRRATTCGICGRTPTSRARVPSWGRRSHRTPLCCCACRRREVKPISGLSRG